jgi:fatty acid desaturase
LRVWAIPAIVLIGAAPWYRMVEVYLLGILAMGLNGLRNVVAHRYLSSGEPMSHEEQLRDSITIEGGWLTELFFPLGLRYHALHHLFPAIPYHNLPAAHRRLMEELPADAAYRQSVYPTFWSAFAAVLGDIRREKDDGGKRAAAWYRRRRRWYQKHRPGQRPAAETASEAIRSLSSL